MKQFMLKTECFPVLICICTISSHDLSIKIRPPHILSLRANVKLRTFQKDIACSRLAKLSSVIYMRVHHNVVTDTVLVVTNLIVLHYDETMAMFGMRGVLIYR